MKIPTIIVVKENSPVEHAVLFKDHIACHPSKIKFLTEGVGCMFPKTTFKVLTEKEWENYGKEKEKN